MERITFKVRHQFVMIVFFFFFFFIIVFSSKRIDVIDYQEAKIHVFNILALKSLADFLPGVHFHRNCKTPRQLEPFFPHKKNRRNKSKFLQYFRAISKLGNRLSKSSNVVTSQKRRKIIAITTRKCT